MPKESPFEDFAHTYLYELEDGTSTLDLVKIGFASKKIRECTGTVWLIGNGGSSCLASHMATDLQLAGVRAISLTDVAAITTIGNDQSFSRTFEAQIALLAQPGDILIAISGSGTSPNIYDACSWGSTWGVMGEGVFTIGVFGQSGTGKYRAPVDLELLAPSAHMGVAQDLHQVILHLICYWLMKGQAPRG